MPLTYESVNWVLPNGYSNNRLDSVYLITPDMAFYHMWRSTDPEKSNPATFKQVVINENKKKLAADPSYEMPLPVLGAGIHEGEGEISFIDGRMRFTALKMSGIDAIPAIIEGKPEEILSLPFVKPLPAALRLKIEDNEDKGRFIGEGDELIEAKKKWAAANKEGFMKWCNDRGYGAIADKLYDYYLQHGQMPPQRDIDKMKREAEKDERQQELEDPLKYRSRGIGMGR